MRQEFKRSLSKMVAVSQSDEREPLKSESTEPHSVSPHMIPALAHKQYLADYMKLFMEEGEELTLSENQAAPLLTQVSPYNFFHNPFSQLFLIFLFICLTQSIIPIFRLYRKFCLASNIRSMADLLHADAVQQLEMALLGSQAAQVIDLLSRRIITD